MDRAWLDLLWDLMFLGHFSIIIHTGKLYCQLYSLYDYYAGPISIYLWYLFCIKKIEQYFLVNIRIFILDKSKAIITTIIYSKYYPIYHFSFEVGFQYLLFDTPLIWLKTHSSWSCICLLKLNKRSKLFEFFHKAGFCTNPSNDDFPKAEHDESFCVQQLTVPTCHQRSEF